MAGMCKASSTVYDFLHSDPTFSPSRWQSGTICVQGRQRREKREKRRRRDGTGGREEEKTVTVESVPLNILLVLFNKLKTRVTDSSQTAPLIPLMGPQPGKTLISGYIRAGLLVTQEVCSWMVV